MSMHSDKPGELEDVLAEYLRAAEAGQPPERDAFLARHPELASELRTFLDNRAEMERLAEPLRTPGTRLRYFGDYELLEEIARGGMGVVYKARQVSLNRVVALKMILAGQLASADDVRRFHTEAEAAANLDHPNIVPIYEVGEYEGQHYFSMKLIEGGNLGDKVPELVKRPAEAAAIMAAVSLAVHFAHQRGILHRDLKPGNILLDRDGRPHVTDFGLAKRIEGDDKLTKSGAIVGTPSYMAPEQARAEKGLSTAVDVYSLGAILYELLTGRPPFHAETPFHTLMQVLDDEPTSPRDWVADIDPNLEAICLRCLLKHPADRYESAAALAADLECWLGGEPIVARRPSVGERLLKSFRRKPYRLTYPFIVILASLGFSSILLSWPRFIADFASLAIVLVLVFRFVLRTKTPREKVLEEQLRKVIRDGAIPAWRNASQLDEIEKLRFEIQRLKDEQRCS